VLAAAGLPFLPRHAWVEVDVALLRHNVRMLRSRLDPVSSLGVVVKADGYGHGIELAAITAIESGATWLLVATLDEALAVRRAGVRAPVLILFPIPVSGLAEAAAAGSAVAVGDTQGARLLVDGWGAASGSTIAPGAAPAPRLEVHLELDTGMTRNGVRPADAVAVARLLARAPGVRLSGAWSHLASPEDARVTADQVRVFDEVTEALAAAGVAIGVRHLASSGAVLLGSAPAYDAVRVGIAAYGVVPDEFRDPNGGDHGLRPALSLRAHAVRIVDVPRGTRVGYGGDWEAARDSRIATLPLGYADGYARRSWPGAFVLVGGRRAPVVGRVSTDSLSVDVTDAGPIDLDAEFVLLGRQRDDEIDARELARVRGTIPWDVISPLSARLPRVYRDGDSPVAVRLPGATPTWSSRPT
jgi:alanine racemase